MNDSDRRDSSGLLLADAKSSLTARDGEGAWSMGLQGSLKKTSGEKLVRMREVNFGGEFLDFSVHHVHYSSTTIGFENCRSME